MTTNNSSNQVFTNNTDGFTLGGGTTERDLTLTGGNVTVAGSGSNVYTFPNATSSLAALGLAQTFTAQQIIFGTATNDSAASGYIGEYISSNIAIGSAVSLTTTTTANITSISLTGGDWDVEGNVGFISASGTIGTVLIAAVSNGVSATLPTSPAGGSYTQLSQTLPASVTQIMVTGRSRISLASTTTIYLVAQATFSVSTMTGYGFIGARRAR